MSNLLIPSFLVSDVSESLRSLTKNERCEQIAQVAHQKWATISKSLRSLTKNEWMSKSLVFWVNCSFANFFAKNELFAQKTVEQIPSAAYQENTLLERPSKFHISSSHTRNISAILINCLYQPRSTGILICYCRIFCNFRKWVHCYRLGLIFWVQFQKMANFGTHAAKFSFSKKHRDLKKNFFVIIFRNLPYTSKNNCQKEKFKI